MKIAFFIHGKPNKNGKSADCFDGLGEKIADDIFKMLDTRPKDMPKEVLMVAAQTWKGRAYSHYTYYRSDVKDTSSRGSYFAMTIVLEGMICPNLSKMFEELLRGAFSTVVQKQWNLFGPDRTYQINTFEERENEIQNMEKQIIEFVKNDFSPICEARTVMQSIATGTHVWISPDYKTMKQQYKDYTNLSAAYRELEAKANQIPSLKEERDAAKQQLSQKQSELNTTKNQVERLKSEIERLSKDSLDQRKSLEFLSAKLYEPLSELLKKFKGIRTETAKSELLWLRMSRFIPLLNLILLCMLGFFCYRWTSDLKKNSATGDNTEMIADYETQIQDYKQQINWMNNETLKLKDSINKLKPVTTETTNEVRPTEKCEFTINNKPYKGEQTPVRIGTETKIWASKLLQGHTWRAEGAQIVGDRNKQEVTLKIIEPINPQKPIVTITYRTDNWDNQTNKIQLKAVK